MMESDGVDDVTILVNASPDKVMGATPMYADGFPSISNAVLCAKASMLLQVRWSNCKSQTYRSLTINTYIHLLQC